MMFDLLQKKTLLSLLLVGSCIGCAHQKADKPILDYARKNGNSPPPTMLTYRNAGLENAEHLHVVSLNAHIQTLNAENIDTPAKLAKIATNFQDHDHDGMLNKVDLDDDGDGFNDGYEISVDTDPLDPKSNPGSKPFVFSVRVREEYRYRTPKNFLSQLPYKKLSRGIEFVITTKIRNGRIPLRSTYNYNVDCESDGVLEAEGVTGDFVCVYNARGRFRISIYDNTGKREGFPRIQFPLFGGGTLVGINQWGTGKWTSMAGAFARCKDLSDEGGAATDAPDLSEVDDLSFMFQNTKFNQDISKWDTSTIYNMQGMFAGAKLFNQNIGGWDTANVEDMSNMFEEATAFNQDIGDWDTGYVRNMTKMFEDATVFNQNIGRWDTRFVENMSKMFSGASSFNQDIGLWDIRAVKNMSLMFEKASAFDQSLSEWDLRYLISLDGYVRRRLSHAPRYLLSKRSKQKKSP